MKRLTLKVDDELYLFIINRNKTVRYETYVVKEIQAKHKMLILTNYMNEFKLGYAYLNMVVKVADCPNPAKECIRRQNELRGIV